MLAPVVWTGIGRAAGAGGESVHSNVREPNGDSADLSSSNHVLTGPGTPTGFGPQILPRLLVAVDDPNVEKSAARVMPVHCNRTGVCKA